MGTNMGIKEISGEEYIVQYDAATATVFFQGSLSLTGIEDFAPISQLLEAAIDNAVSKLTLDVRQLEFLNSSGISVLSRFVIKARNQLQTALVVQGAENIIWQKRSLKNLQRLMPAMELEWT